MRKTFPSVSTPSASTDGHCQNHDPAANSGKPENPRGHPRWLRVLLATVLYVLALLGAFGANHALASPVAVNGASFDFAVSATNVAAGNSFEVRKFAGLDKSGSAGVGVGPLGVEASGYVHAGVEFGTAVGAGTANVDMKGSVNLSANAPLQVGQATTINSHFAVSGGSISSSAAVSSLSLAAPIKFGAKLEGRLFGMKETLLKKDWDYSLFNYSASGANVSPYHAGNAFYELDITRPTGLASSAGVQSTGLFQTSQYAKVVRAAFDVDSVFTAATGIPMGVSGCLYALVVRGCVSADLLDLDLALNGGLRRTVTVQPTVTATYTVEDGRVFTLDANQAFSFTPLANYAYGDYADFQVEYSFGGIGNAVTSAEVDLDLELDILKGSIDVDYRWLACKWLQLSCKWKWKDLASASFGPLIEKDWNLYEKDFVLDSQQFNLAGVFNNMTTTFSIPFAAAGAISEAAWLVGNGTVVAPITDVPEPSPLLLLGGALAAVGIQRRRNFNLLRVT